MAEIKAALFKADVGKIFFVVIFAFLSIALFSQPKTASAAMCIYSNTDGLPVGSFNNAANWINCNGNAPGVGDTVILVSGTSTQLTADKAISSINSSGTIDARSFGLNVTSTVDLDNGGVVTSTSGYLGFGGALYIRNVGANKVGTVSGNINVSSTSQILGESSVFDIGSGTSTFYGDVYFAQQATIYGRTGTLEILGSLLNISVATLNMSSAKLLFSGSGATSFSHTIQNPTDFGDIVVDKTSNAVTLSGNGTSTGNVSIRGGGFSLGSNTFRIGGNMIVDSGGTFTPDTGTIDFIGGIAQSVSSTGFATTTISGTGSVTLTANTTSTGPLTISSGTFNTGAYTLFSGGNFTVGSGGVFNPGTGTVNFNGAGAQSVSSTGFYDLVVNKSGGTATFSNNSTISSTLLLSNGGLNLGNGTTTFTAAGTPLQLWGGTFNPANGTVEYHKNQTVASTTFYNLSITPTTAKTATLNASTTALGAVTVNANGTLAVGANNFTVLGAINNTGLITESTGSIIHTAESVKITDSSGTEVSSLSNTGSVYVTVQDANRNLNGAAVETFTIPVSFNAAAGSDAETLTLTETSVSSGIFRNASAIALVSSSAKTLGNSQFELLASGIGTANYTDSQHTADTASDAVTLTYVAPTVATVSGGGGGGGGGPAPSPTTQATTTTAGPVTAIDTAALQKLQSAGLAVHQLVKLPDDGDPATQEDSAVYYLGADGRRHAFPNANAYKTWFCDYSGLKVIALADLSAIPLGRNVIYKSGRKMIKILSDPKVYAVEKGGILRWIKTEQLAVELYGANWNKQIDDVDVAFFQNYFLGQTIEKASDFIPSNVEKSVSYPSDSMGIQGYTESAAANIGLTCQSAAASTE